ncbi:MAG TPA: DUF448 domain-containing protein [Desulfobulbus sp.]|nr:DUF448 domain-containing protein [Desulfobulbus sp.]
MMRRRHVPMRTCKGCGVKRPQRELRRFVVEKGVMVESRIFPGRAVYCCRQETCLERLLKNKKALNRAFRLKN